MRGQRTYSKEDILTDLEAQLLSQSRPRLTVTPGLAMAEEAEAVEAVVPMDVEEEAEVNINEKICLHCFSSRRWRRMWWWMWLEEKEGCN